MKFYPKTHGILILKFSRLHSKFCFINYIHNQDLKRKYSGSRECARDHPSSSLFHKPTDSEPRFYQIKRPCEI